MRGWLGVGLIGLLFAPSAPALEYAPRLYIKSASGVLNNNTSEGASRLVLAGTKLGADFFLSPRLAVRIGYHADMDLSLGRLPLWGFEGGARYYFWNRGTLIRNSEEDLTSESRDRWSAFAGIDVAQRNYFLGTEFNPDNTTTDITGNYFALVAVVGVELALTTRWAVSFEVNLSTLNFATSSRNVNLAAYLGVLGLNYAW